MRADDPGSVPLRAVLDRRDLALRAVVLPPGSEPRVRWAAVSELLEPGPYLNGGELLLTAGVNMPTASDDLHRYVTRLVAAEVGALGFGLTPVFDTVPEALVEWCAAYGLPLVEAPGATPFVAIGRAVGELLEEQHVEELRRMGEAHRTLARSVTAAAPTKRVLDTLAEVLDCWAVLLTDGDRKAAAARGGSGSRASRAGSGPPRLSTEVAELADKLRGPDGPRSAKAHMGGDQVFLHAVAETSVVLVGRPDPLAMPERAALGTAVALLGVLPNGDAPTPGPGPLIGRLLLDPGSRNDLAPLLAELTGGNRSADADRAFRALRAVRSEQGNALDARGLSALLATEIVDSGSRAADGTTTVRAVVADLGSDGAHADLLGALRSRGWLGALSRATGPDGLPGADAEAAAMLVRARASGRPLVATAHADPLDTAIDPGSARQAAREILGPLSGDTDDARLLRTTLHTWLAQHGNWDRASSALGAHRNSVRYRIGRVERDLDVDLSDPEQRMRLWFALTRG